MELNEFVKNIASIFEDEASVNAQTNYREHPEWCSIIALTFMAVVRKKYKVALKPEDLRSCTNITELYNLVLKRQVNI